jgi:hypothetical protein
MDVWLDEPSVQEALHVKGDTIGMTDIGLQEFTNTDSILYLRTLHRNDIQENCIGFARIVC